MEARHKKIVRSWEKRLGAIAAQAADLQGRIEKRRDTRHTLAAWAAELRAAIVGLYDEVHGITRPLPFQNNVVVKDVKNDPYRQLLGRLAPLVPDTTRWDHGDAMEGDLSEGTYAIFKDAIDAADGIGQDDFQVQLLAKKLRKDPGLRGDAAWSAALALVSDGIVNHPALVRLRHVIGEPFEGTNIANTLNPVKDDPPLKVG